MKGKHSKKILSLVLALFMLLCMLPSNIFAGNGDSASLSSLVVFLAASETPTNDNVILKNSTDTYPTTNVFSSDKLVYDLGYVYDDTNMIGFLPTVSNEESITVYFNNANGEERSQKFTSGSAGRVPGISAGNNEFKVVVTPKGKEESDSETTTYTIKLASKPTLKSLSVTADGSNLNFDSAFNAKTFEYTLTVPTGVNELDFAATGKKNTYSVSYNGNADPTVDITDKNKVEITVSANGVENVYSINLQRKNADSVKFNVTPSDAIISVYDASGSRVLPASDGNYNIMLGTNTYSYTVTKYGYVAQSGNIESQNVTVTLSKASDSGISDVGAYWKNFRGNDSNMAIVNTKTPIDKDSTSLLWSYKFGGAADWTNAPSVQIIADNSLIVLAGSKIYKLNLETGNVIASADMTAKINWGYTPPAYAEGMIFCPLADGTIQAFNAKTLESVWIYKDDLKGQSLSPICYSDGYIYTGFWNSETRDAHYVCLSVTDENPAKTDEAKTASWKITHTGGFYWCGGACIGDYVLFGSADGQDSSVNGTSYLYSVNKHTGEVVQKLALENASDIRSSIAYDSSSNKVYWTSTGGYLYSASIDTATGKLSEFKSLDLNEPSTTTPVVYNGRVYVYTYAGFASGHLHIVSADTLNLIVSVDAGPVQSSPILTTAYEDTGYLYLYATANMKKGGIDLFKVKTDATKAEDITKIELYDAAGFEEYCISSIICSANGTLYYKNDSCNVFAVGTPSYAYVIDLIDAIGDVDLDSETAISTARGAYDALDESDKTKVTNYAKLTAAEAVLNQLKADETVKLIDDIGDKITKESKDAIKKARSAYDALTDEQKKLVPEDKLASLEKAEAELKKLQDSTPEGATKGVSVTINGVTYVVSEKTKAAMEAMQSVLDAKAPSEKEIIDAYKTYESLTYNEKLFAANYKEFEEKVLTKQGAQNHYDEPTKVDARENEEDVLPWHIKLVVKNVDITDENIAKVKETLGDESEFSILYDISFIDTLTNKEWKPTSLVSIKLPKPISKYESYAIVHIGENDEYGFIQPVEEDGNLKFETMDFSSYGISSFEGSWDELLGSEEVKKNAVVWPWAIGGAAGVGGVLWAIFNKRKDDFDEE